MQKRKIRHTAGKLLAFSMILAIAAEPVTATAKTSQQLRQEADAIEEERDEAQGELNALDNELVSLLSEINVLEGEIATNEAEIESAKEDLAAAEAAEQEQYEAMKSRIRYMYEREEKSLFTMFVESGSITEFLNQVDYATAVQDYDRQLLQNYEFLVADITELKANLEDEQQQLQAQQSQLATKQSSLNSMITAKRQEVANFDEQLAAAKEAASKKAAEEEEERRAAAARAAAAAVASANASSGNSQSSQSSSSGSSASSGSGTANAATTDSGSNPAPTTGISGSAVVAYANQFVGNPYVWGGNSLTNGCDCSGFVVLVYAHFGINLSASRQSSLLARVGQPVSYENMQAGDIVCYPGHVGIYTGAGTIVEAQSSSAGITNYRPVTCHTIVAIRRVI